MNEEEIKQSQKLVSDALEEITKGVNKAVYDYVQEQYLVSIAKAICYFGLTSVEASELFAKMAPEMKEKVIKLCTFNKEDLEVLKEINQIVDNSELDFKNSYAQLSANALYSGSDFLKEKLAAFYKETPCMKNQVEKSIFAFEDIVMLDDRAIQKLLREVDAQELAKALKGTSTAVQEKIYRNMSTRAATMLKEDIEYMGPVRQSDVLECQGKIIKSVLWLESIGEIVIFKETNEDLVE